jgi:hypothetical protein
MKKLILLLKLIFTTLRLLAENKVTFSEKIFFVAFTLKFNLAFALLMLQISTLFLYYPNIKKNIGKVKIYFYFKSLVFKPIITQFNIVARNYIW